MCERCKGRPQSGRQGFKKNNSVLQIRSVFDSNLLWAEADGFILLTSDPYTRVLRAAATSMASIHAQGEQK